MTGDAAPGYLAALRAFDADLFLLEQGLRTLARKEDRSVEGCEALMRWAGERGFHTRLLESERPRSDRGVGPRYSLFIGSGERQLDAALRSTRIEEQPGHPALERARRETGRLLGYPDCCVARFAAEPRNDDRTVLSRLLGPRLLGPWDPLDNWLVPPALVRHYPCRPGCAVTRRWAARAMGCVEQLDPGLGRALRWVTSRPLLVFDRFRVAVLDGSLRPDGAIEVERAYSFLELSADESAGRSVALRRFAEGLHRLPAVIGPAGLRGARLVRFRAPPEISP